MNQLQAKKCKQCQREFTPKRKNQSFCSSACRKKYYHYDVYKPYKPDIIDINLPIIRKFNCLNCGREVIVQNPKYKKTKFCCSKCEHEYWKHHENKAKFVYREFICEECHKKVEITKAEDLRIKFCSKECAQKHNNKLRKKYTKPKELKIS